MSNEIIFARLSKKKIQSEGQTSDEDDTALKIFPGSIDLWFYVLLKNFSLI
jgi:hypothetical protein